MSRTSALAILSMLVPTAPAAIEAPPVQAYSAFSPDPARHFDFWTGEWDVNLRTLRDNQTFEDSVTARASVRSVLDGKAVLELWDSVPIQGFGLHYYDLMAREWVLWLDWPEPNRSRLVRLEGGFRHGRGEFRGTPPDAEGRTITTIHSFSDITPFSLRWDDMYSADEGKTWRRNWLMEFTRTAVDPKWPIRQTAVPTYKDGKRCDDERFRPYELLVGTWRGSAASFEVYPILDGCAVIGFLEDDDGADELVFMTFDSFAERWVAAVLDDVPETGLVRYAGASTWTKLDADRAGQLQWTVWRKPGDLEKAGAQLLYQRGNREVRLERAEDQPPLGMTGTNARSGRTWMPAASATARGTSTTRTRAMSIR